MRKFLTLSLLALFAISMQAQDAGTKTIQGCLQFARHHYFLTDSSGAQHQLSGEANKLKAHIGHEVEITGTEGVKTVNTTTDGSASSTKELAVFKVQSIKHIADTCTKK
jgi:hypothetical protein